MLRTERRTAEILLVEDNEADARLADEALKESKIPNRLHVVADGLAAMKFLHREGQHRDAPRPDVILLDLNMPRMDGRAVLQAVKRELRSIPIVVLTTSSAERDVAQSYDLHANCFITKPLELDQFIDVVQSIEHFWLDTVQLPPSP